MRTIFFATLAIILMVTTSDAGYGPSKSSGSSDHSALSNLSYAVSGHTGFVGGSGNKGYVMLWGSSTIGTDSVLYQDGVNIGIGTIVPRAMLEVGTAASLPSGSSPAAIIKGNLLVDGKVYGDGSALTNLPSGVSGANPTGTIGLTAVNGSAATFLRSDGAPALSQAISPTWTGNHIFNPAAGNTIFQSGNVGIGTTTAGIAGLQVGSGNQGISATLNTAGALIRGNLEVDGKIYGDGSGVTNISIASVLANPTGTIGLTIVNGSAVTGMRSDGAPALSQAISPNWTGNHTFTPSSGGTVFAQGNVGIGTSAVSAAGLQVGTGNHTISATLGTNSALIRGNLEVDGKIYGDGSQLTNLPSGVSGANPTAAVGLTATNGSSPSFLRADGAPALSQAISPTWTGNHIFTPASGNTLISAGNLGIGSATPAQKLTIVGDVFETGNVGIGTYTPIAGLQVGAGGSTLSVPHTTSSVLVKGNLEVDGKVYGDGSMLVGISGGGGSFTLTQNKIPKAATTSSLTDSNMWDVSSNIGVGTSAPVGLLDVNRKLTVLSGGNIGIGSTAPQRLLDVEGTSYFSGNVGIGTTSSTADTLVAKPAILNVYGRAHFRYLQGDTGENFTAGNDNYLPIGGTQNIVIGAYANNTYQLTGNRNIIMGYYAGRRVGSAAENVFIGHNAAQHASSSSYIVAIGQDAGSAYGAACGSAMNGHTYGVYLGSQSCGASATETNAIVIAGQDGRGQGSNTTVLGTTATTGTFIPGGNVGIGTVTAGAGLVVGSGGTLNYADGAGDIYAVDELEIDGNVYLGNGSTDRTTIDGAIYAKSQYQYFKSGTTCYRVNLITMTSAVVTCSSTSM